MTTATKIQEIQNIVRQLQAGQNADAFDTGAKKAAFKTLLAEVDVLDVKISYLFEKYDSFDWEKIPNLAWVELLLEIRKRWQTKCKICLGIGHEPKSCGSKNNIDAWCIANKNRYLWGQTKYLIWYK